MTKKEQELRDKEIVEAIHKNTLKILDEIGIAFLDEEALEFMKSKGIRVKGNRAYFTEKQVMDALDVTTKEFTVYARNPKYNVSMNTQDLYMTPGYGSPFICEADGTVRNGTLDDFLKLAMIVQSSDEFSINGGILVQPSDIDPAISAEAMVYSTICRSDKAVFSVCGDGKVAENIMEMMKIVFGGSIENIPCTFNLISPLAPLGLAKNAIETVRVCAENGQPIAICPAPMAGTTGPITLAGNISVANAEILGINVYAQLLRPGLPLIYAFAATVSDMTCMAVSNCCPGFNQESKYASLLAKKYGLPCRSGGGMSNASGVTAQAGVESAMNFFESFSEGANLMMHATGSLHSFMSVSLEKFILDIETYTRMKYYFSDMPADEDALAFDVIKEVIEDDETFITMDHTYEHCRTTPWYPQVSLHKNTTGDPNKALMDSIQARLQKVLDDYECPALPEDVRSKIDDVMRRVGMKESDIARV